MIDLSVRILCFVWLNLICARYTHPASRSANQRANQGPRLMFLKPSIGRAATNPWTRRRQSPGPGEPSTKRALGQRQCVLAQLHRLAALRRAQFLGLRSPRQPSVSGVSGANIRYFLTTARLLLFA